MPYIRSELNFLGNYKKSNSFPVLNKTTSVYIFCTRQQDCIFVTRLYIFHEKLKCLADWTHHYGN